MFSGNDLSEDYVDDNNENLYKILNDNISNNMLRTASLSTPVSNIYVDLAFVIDTTGSMSPYIKNVKDNVTDFAKYLEDKGINLRVAIVEYRDTTSDGINSTIVHKWNGSTWHTKTTDMVTTLTKLSANGGGDEPETAIGGLGYLVDDADTLLWSSKVFKFAVLLTDACSCEIYYDRLYFVANNRMYKFYDEIGWRWHSFECECVCYRNRR